MKIIVKTLSIFVCGLAIFNINNVTAQESLNPVILSVSPNPAHEGDTITITGKNLEYQSECNPFPGQGITHPILSIDGEEQDYISSAFSMNTTWTNEKITTNVLTKSGKMQIKNCFNLLSNEYVVLPLLKRSLTLTSVEPSNGIYPGSVITINGHDLGNEMSINDQFYLNGHYVDRSNIDSWTNDNFKLRIPSEIGGQEHVKGEIKVTPGNYELQVHSSYYATPIDSTKVSFTVSSCDSSAWSCSSWSSCTIQGIQKRTCNKTFNCPAIISGSPEITQLCTPIKTEDVLQLRVSEQTSQPNEVPQQNTFIKSIIKMLIDFLSKFS